MSCAEHPGRDRRFPLEIRAARTPDATALLWRCGSKTVEGQGGRTGSRSHAVGGGPGEGPGVPPLGAVSFRDLDRWTRVIARSLIERGIAGGERVGLLLPPGPSCPVLLLALLRAGCVAVPLSTRIPETAIPGTLERIGCRRLISAFHGSLQPTATIELIDAAGFAGSEACTDPDPADDPCPPFNRKADATIVFTSGSAGVPKAALHTFENHWASAVGANRNIPLRPGDRWLLSLPHWHVGGLAVVMRCLQAGAAVAIADGDEPLAEAVATFGATHLSLVATQLYRLLGDPRGRTALRTAKAVLLGGGPVPFPLIEEAARDGVRLVASYGSTELASQVTATRPRDSVELLRTAGRPLDFREIAVDEGEILARGRTLFCGYVDGATVDPARDAAGWFHSGDLGRLDAHGRLLVTGRRDAMFISGGENIHPEEIEREILRYPGALEAIVVPIPDPEFGARPAAFLRTADGSLPDTAALGLFLRGTLPGFKVPVLYLAWPELTTGLKPDRRVLAELAQSSDGSRPLTFPCGGKRIRPSRETDGGGEKTLPDSRPQRRTE